LALGLGSGLGQLVAALLLMVFSSSHGWRAVFALTAGFAFAITLASLRWARPVHSADRQQYVDLPSAGLLFAGALAVLAPIIEGRRLGWPAWMAASALVGVMALAGLRQRQLLLAQRGGVPLIAPALLKDRRFTQALLVVFVFYGGVASFFMLLSVHLQTAHGLRPLAAAITFSVMVVGFLIATFGANTLRVTWGRRTPTVGAMALAAGHLLLGAATAMHAPIWTQWPLLGGAGFAMGLVMSPLIANAVSLAPVAQAATASGLVGTAQWLGNACGVALVAGLYNSLLEGGAASGTAMAASHLTFALMAAVVSYLLFIAPPHLSIKRST
jgi:predicted MFS family arabinose efflux permease